MVLLVGPGKGALKRGQKGSFLLGVLTGLWTTSEAKCLLHVIFDYYNHIAAFIMAQFYGHYTLEVLTIFA